MIAVALPVLLGAAAAAIDLAVLTAEGQRVQAVADNAALSGARLYTNPEAVEMVVGRVVAENNQSTSWQVRPSTVICYGPGDDVAGYRMLTGDEHAVEVNAEADFSFFFGRLIGLTTTTVHRRAVAKLVVQSDGLGNAFIFGGATEDDYDAVKIMGQRVQLIGDIHSNSNVLLGGLRTSVDGNVSHTGEMEINAPRFSMTGIDYYIDPQPYPINYTFEEFDVPPWDHIVNGDLTVSGAVRIPSGRWRIHGDVNFSSNGIACTNALFVVDGNVSATGRNKWLKNVTFVARGRITLSGAGSYYSPYQDNLFAFSALDDTNSLTEQGISINAADCTISGICFAPNSNLSINGSREVSYAVGLIAETVDLMGSFSVFSGPPETPDEGDVISDVRLVL